MLLTLAAAGSAAEEELPLLESVTLAKPKRIVINNPIQTQREILGTRVVQAAVQRVSTPRRVRPAAPVVHACGNQEYVTLEKSTRAGIDQAWRDTEAGRWGYGFRDRDEYERWQAAHMSLFEDTHEACKQAAACTSRAGDAAPQRCNEAAWHFAGWLQTVREFAAKVKEMEHSQAPSLCSLSPDANDLSDCFDRLATRIDEDCSGGQCRTVSRCWRSVAYLDEAIHQAESACGFAGQPLAQCRGWQDATARRRETFNRCETLYRNAGLNIKPVL